MPSLTTPVARRHTHSYCHLPLSLFSSSCHALYVPACLDSHTHAHRNADCDGVRSLISSPNLLRDLYTRLSHPRAHMYTYLNGGSCPFCYSCCCCCCYCSSGDGLLSLAVYVCEGNREKGNVRGNSKGSGPGTQKHVDTRAHIHTYTHDGV